MDPHSQLQVAVDDAAEGQSASQQQQQPEEQNESAQKAHDWDMFIRYLCSQEPPLSPKQCTGEHVIEFLKYVDLEICECTVTAWDGLVSRLCEAYEENINAQPAAADSNPLEKGDNPFRWDTVNLFLRRMEELQKATTEIPDAETQRDWNAFTEYLRNQNPRLTPKNCSSKHVIDFLKYSDKFSHTVGCDFFDSPVVEPRSKPSCSCPSAHDRDSLSGLISLLHRYYGDIVGPTFDSPVVEPRSKPCDDEKMKGHLLQGKKLLPHGTAVEQFYVAEKLHEKPMAINVPGVRLVRCPKCRNLLAENAEFPVYQCGGCGTVLTAKNRAISVEGGTSTGSIQNFWQNLSGDSSMNREWASAVTEKPPQQQLQQQVQSDSEEVSHDVDDVDWAVELSNNSVELEPFHKSDSDTNEWHLQQAEKDETSCAEVLNLMEATSECKAGSSTTPIDSLFSDARLSHCREAPIYGRDDVKKKVIEFLSADDCMDHNVSVIRIGGIGGVGKTTLVKRVYDELIPYAIFEARAWVSVNERLDIKGITKAVVESLAGTSCGLTGLREVQEAVKEELMGKRFLLVLDNVCDDAPNFWSSLLVPLSVGANGSIIIATTQSEKESVMDTLSHFKLDRLSESECWMVFQQQVFDRWDQEVCSNLMEIGKQIIRRCEGLPLAVRAFGGLLQSDLNDRSWNAILESSLWDDDGNLPALRVCCDHLTVHLQQCFQYCSLFPKGYMFDKDHLIRLWMSQGFIENEEGKHGQDLGCEYFNEMLEMSFFQLSPISVPTEKKYMMNDLCHDLAQFLSVNKCLRTETCKLSSIPDAVRHVSLVSSGFDTTLQFASFKELGDIHTLLLINSSIMKWEASAFHVEDPKILNDLFSRLGCLRTLDLSFTDIEEVPESIDNLQHLCYLALNRTNIRKLPESICSLYNLQTLELQGCNYLSQLPTQLKNLTNLQHLDASKESGFISMPPGIGQLTGLQTLSTFTVGRGEQWCGIRELKDLMNLSGAFCIGGLCNVVNGEEAEEAQLKMKKNLRTLTLQWFNCGEDLEDDQSAETAFEVLQNLQPHNNLEELTIRDYSGDQFPSWITDPSFLKLMSITLDNCYECDDLPLLGQLPSLKHLSIRMMDGIQRLGHAFCGSGPSRGFQSLETLKLWDMPELIEWSGVEEEYFPRLRNLSISRCNKLRGLPCFPSLLELSIHYCTQLPDLPTFPCLKTLKIDGLQILPLPQLNLPALETLEICNCNQVLLEDSLSHLPSLKQLKVNRCPELNFSPSDKLPSTLQVVEIRGSCALLSSWCPDGFEEITDAHQARRKFVRCKTTTKQGNSVDDFSTCQVVDSEMLSFGAIEGELPAKTAVEGSSSGLSTVGSTGQRQSKKRKEMGTVRTVRVSAAQTGNMENLPDDGYTWRKYAQKEILGSKFPRTRMWTDRVSEAQTTVRVSAAQTGNMENLPDDGYTWRKFAQKEILGSKFPRSYFRCAHRNSCLAMKRVQRADEDPYTYEVTYCGDHTCQTSTKLRNSELERMKHLLSGMLSFGASGGELPATPAVEEPSELPATPAVEESWSGLTSVGSLGQTSRKEPDLMDSASEYEGRDAMFESEEKRNSDG